VDACRERLDAAVADAAAMAEARAAASELAVRAAAALAVRDGSRAVAVDQHPQRLSREALFLLVFGSRPGIKSGLLRRFGASIVPDHPEAIAEEACLMQDVMPSLRREAAKV